MTTLLEIVQSVSRLQAQPVPTEVITSTDDGVLQWLELSNRVGRDLIQEGGRDGWPQLQREYVFSTVAAQAEYQFPADFQRLIVESTWDRAETWPINGPMSAVQWQWLKSGVIGSGVTHQRYRIRRSSTALGLRFVIDPTPADVRTLVFEYVSTSWVSSADGATARSEWAADTDLLLLPRDVMQTGMLWRWRQLRGFDYQEQYSEFVMERERALRQVRPAAPIRMGGRRSHLLGYDNIPDTGVGL